MFAAKRINSAYFSIYGKNISSNLSLGAEQIWQKEQGLTALTKQWANGQTLTFAHDPLAGKTCQIIMTEKDVEAFTRLQTALHKVCQAYKFSDGTPTFLISYERNS